MSNIKQQLYNICESFLNERANTLHEIIDGLQKSLQSETKSSAGDKHETGRVMLQLEREKAGNQFAAIQKQQELLVKTNINNSSTKIRLGSLVETSNGIYFLAISKGLVTLNNQPYFVIAPQSPIGKLLLGKQVDEEVVFNGKTIRIKSIS
ncbi:3-oxoacyl-ACP synthase [Pseudofulvibacter geojedonensis]|uniref:3-oxoacyl-ACP synthase n=1 Tax=Pseudofulvibacter geojedonensis TaxID=1123758 RepID=A0ABW3I0H9_9FLAO